MFPPFGFNRKRCRPGCRCNRSPIARNARRCGAVTALPTSAPVPAPIRPPAIAPPALPPETADPISAPVPAPIAPPASVPVCCCGVWQADTDAAPASASARARVCLHDCCSPCGSVESGADPVAVVIISPLRAPSARRPAIVTAAAVRRNSRGCGVTAEPMSAPGARADRGAGERAAGAAAGHRRADESARPRAERPADERVLLLRRLAGRDGESGGERGRKSQKSSSSRTPSPVRSHPCAAEPRFVAPQSPKSRRKASSSLRLGTIPQFAQSFNTYEPRRRFHATTQVRFLLTGLVSGPYACIRQSAGRPPPCERRRKVRAPYGYGAG